MYNAIDIARYIIKYINDKEYRVSNLKLQKLLYFVQAYFLITTNKPAFYDRIEAWEFGPVVPSVYRRYSAYGANFIPTKRKELRDDYSIEEIDYSLLSKILDTKKIEEVVDKFSDCSSIYMTDLTKKQEPWKNAIHIGKDIEITQENIKKYFDNIEE